MKLTIAISNANSGINKVPSCVKPTSSTDFLNAQTKTLLTLNKSSHLQIQTFHCIILGFGLIKATLVNHNHIYTTCTQALELDTEAGDS